MMASRLIFLTFMCGILFAQESTEDSSVDDYTAAEKEVFESIKKESDKKERKSRRKMITRDTYESLATQTLVTVGGIFISANVSSDLFTTYSTIALIYPTTKLIQIRKSDATKEVKAKRQQTVITASMVGAIPIINVMATLVFMPVVFASEVINSID
tara:strand:+ start:1911 stop:2381 length:471 start_codon:yes stop_codon:yes gene_type:complete